MNKQSYYEKQKERRSKIPDEYKGVLFLEWIPTNMEEGVGNPSFIKIRVYATNKNYALKVLHGFGEINEQVNMPKAWTKPSSIYRKKLSTILENWLEQKLDYYGIDYE